MFSVYCLTPMFISAYIEFVLVQFLGNLGIIYVFLWRISNKAFHIRFFVVVVEYKKN